MVLQSEAAESFQQSDVDKVDMKLPHFLVYLLWLTPTNVSTELLFELYEPGRWGKQHTNTHTHTHKPPSECSITLETEAWFICSQIKSTEVERVEKIIPSKQEKNLKLSINNTKRVLFMKAVSRFVGIHT